MSRRTPRAALFLLAAAAATSGCGGDALPAAPSALLSPAGASLATSSVIPADYHEMPMPEPEPTPTPPAAAVTISIVGPSGTAAFMPNPLSAAAGSTVVWTNTDAIVHTIVLDDGTIVGTMQPGESSAPITVTAAAVTYHCTLHPSMVGTIQDPSVPPPAPAPPPDYTPPPDDGYDDY